MTVLEQSSFGSSPSKKIVWQSTNLTATATICERGHHTLLSPNSNNYFWARRSLLVSTLVVVAPFDVLRDGYGRLLFDVIHPIVQLR